MENLAFSFDASFGDFLTTLAREKIMTEYDLDAAVKILTDSLSGMSRDQALHILSGECDLSIRLVALREIVVGGFMRNMVEDCHHVSRRLF